MNRRNNRLPASLDGRDGVLLELDISPELFAESASVGGGWEVGGDGIEGLEVDPRAEVPAGAGEDDDGDVGVMIEG